MKLAEALTLKTLRRARVVAGAEGLHREVRWVHVVDMPDPITWVRPGVFLLTTGYAWPREEELQRTLVRALAERGLAGVGMAVPHFFDRFPPPACEEANQAGLPLVEIPWEIPFVQITEETHGAILAEQYRVLEQSEAIHRGLTRAALEAGSLQDLATTLGRLIQRTVTFEDNEGRVLAAHRIEQMEDRIRRETLERGHSPREFTRLLDRLGYSQMIAGGSRPLRIPPFPELHSAARVVCPIRLKGELVGLVWIIEGESPLSELDLRAAEHAAVVAALHIAHQRALASVEARMGYAFLDSLLEGRFEATPQALERARLLGFDPDGLYRVGVLLLHVPMPLTHEGFLRRERLAERLRRRLHELELPSLLSVSLGQIPFLLPEGCLAEQIWETLADADVSLALSRLHQGAEGVRRGYLEVLSLLPHLAPGCFQRYETLLLPRVLAGDTTAQSAFLDELFNALRSQKNGQLLIDTLLALAHSGFQLKRAAQSLNIHPKTLHYRMERVSELGQLDLDNTETRFKLQLAAHLLSLRDK